MGIGPIFDIDRSFETAGESFSPEIHIADDARLASGIEKEQTRIAHEHMAHYLGYLAMPESSRSESSRLNMRLVEASLFEPGKPSVNQGRLEVIAQKDMYKRTLGEIATRGLEMSENIGLIPDGEKIYFALPKQDRFGNSKLVVVSPPLDVKEDSYQYKLNVERLTELDEKLAAS